MSKKPIILIFLILIGLISSFTIFGLTGNEYLANNTLYYYTLENNSFTDLTGNSTINFGNSAVVTGILENALNMTSSTNYVNGSLTKNLTGAFNFTISAWVKINTQVSGSNAYTFGAYGDWLTAPVGGYFVFSYIYSSPNTKIRCGLGGDDVGNIDRTYTLNPGQWYFITCSYNHVTKKNEVYVNGTLVNTLTGTQGMNFPAKQVFQIGMSGTPNDLYQNHVQDETALFNKVFNSSEINFLWNYGNNATFSQRYNFNDTWNITPNVNEFKFINQSPSDLTNTNLFSTNGTLRIIYNVTKPNATNIYLNYTVNNTRNIFSILNGSVSDLGYNQINSSPNISQQYTFDFIADNQIYPSVNLVNFATLNQNHSRIIINGTNDYFKYAMYNMSFENSQYLELDLLSNNSVCRILYCNSSYTTGNVNANANCFHFATSSNQTTYNHTHNAFVSHNMYAFNLNSTNFIGSVRVSENGFFLVNKQSGTSCNIGVVSNVTRTDTSSITLTGGTSYTNQAVTPDSHLHFFNTSHPDNFKYQICATNTTNTSCDSFRSDNFDITAFPPVIELINPDNESINITTRFYNISWQYILTGATNINFSVYLLNSSDDIIKNLSLGQGNTTYYNWDIVNSNITQGTYKIRVFGNDSFNLTNFDVGETFFVYNDAQLNLTAKYYFTNATISNFNVTLLDYNTGETFYYNSTTYSELNLVKGHNYNIFVDHPNFAFLSVNYSTNTNFNNLTVYMNTTNSVYILIYNSQTLALINISTTITFTSVNYTFSFITSNGTYLASNLTPAIYTVSFNNSQFDPISYIVTMNPDTAQELKAYMIDSNLTELIFFYIQNLASEPLNATINIQQLLNNSFVTIGNKQTDLTGFTYFYLIERTTYRITITSLGYDTRTFDFEPFLVNSPYIIRLNPSAVTSFRTIFDDVDYLLTPQNSTLPVGTNTFSIQTSSANGILLYTYINCNGNISNLSGFPNGATASVQVTTLASEKVSCTYKLSATGFDDVTFYKNYYTQNVNPQTETNLRSSMENLKNSLGNTGGAWTTILAYFIIIGVAGTILGLTGNTIASTFVVFTGIVGFALLGWISPSIAFFTCGLALLIYYLSRGAY